VLQVTADGAQVFVESGEAVALAPYDGSTARVVVRPGRMYSRKAGQATGELAERPVPAFVQAMPPAFRDTLPPRLANLRGRTLEPNPGPQYTRQDVEDWLRGDLDIRPCHVR
jgi:hypothetical protein